MLLSIKILQIQFLLSLVCINKVGNWRDGLVINSLCREKDYRYGVNVVNVLPSLFRYMCVVVWAHGLRYVDEIIAKLEDDPDWTILMARMVRGFSPETFILKVYGCDTYPLEHLYDKIRYLKLLPGNALFIFVKCHNTDGRVMGSGAFRAWQADKMVTFKRYFREKYNPRNPDGSTGHDHVIHGTDNESQTDYMLKLLGYADGIRIFEREVPFAMPHHIQWTGKYRLTSLPLASLRANILFRDEGHVVSRFVRLEETPQYLGVTVPDIYKKYLEEFQYTYLCDHYSHRKYSALQLVDIVRLLRKNPVLVRRSGDNYALLDGVHRASVALAKGVQTIPAVIV